MVFLGDFINIFLISLLKFLVLWAYVLFELVNSYVCSYSSVDFHFIYWNLERPLSHLITEEKLDKNHFVYLKCNDLLLFSNIWYAWLARYILLFGGYSCLGRALCLALGEKGVSVTVLDLFEERGQEVASIIQQKNARLYSNSDIPPAIFIQCDVTKISK